MLTSQNIRSEASILEGHRFHLVPFREKDISEAYLAMLNDPKINRFLEVRFERQTVESTTPFVRSFYGNEEKYMWGIHSRENNVFVGTATLFQINRHHGSAMMGLMVGADSFWGKGASEEALKLIAQYSFETLKLRRLLGGTISTNHGMNFTFKRLGYRCEGRFVKANQIEPNAFVDEFRWALLEEEWRARANR